LIQVVFLICRQRAGPSVLLFALAKRNRVEDAVLSEAA